jgi:hypothetical protein
MKRIRIGRDGDDVEASVFADGLVQLLEKKVRRGTTPRSMSFNLMDVWDKGGTDGLGQALDEMIRRLPIADFGNDPAKVAYRAKAWLMAELTKLNKHGKEESAD